MNKLTVFEVVIIIIAFIFAARWVLNPDGQFEPIIALCAILISVIDLWKRYYRKTAQPVSNLESAQVQEEVSVQINDIGEDQLPPFLILNDKDHVVTNQALDDSGFKPVMVWKGMHLDAGQLLENKIDSELEISEVKEEKHIDDFVKTLNLALLKNNKAKSELFSAINQNLNFKLYNGYYQDNVVSTSLSYAKGGIGGLYMIATLEDYRGKGFGSHITIHPIERLIENGIQHIVLHATKLGERIYSKLGFKSYCNFYIYWLLGKR